MDIENPDQHEAEGTDAESLSLAVESDLRDRRWVASITKFLEARVGQTGYYRDPISVPTEHDLPVRVRYALDDATIAACERLARILRSDLTPIAPGDAR